MRQRRTRTRGSHLLGLLPWAAATLTLLAVGVVWFWSTATLHREADNRTETATQQASTLINGELRRYTDLLRAGSALFAVDKQVSAANFGQYVASLDLPHRYPGALALTVIDPHPDGPTVRFAAPSAAAAYPPGTDLSRMPQVTAALRVATDSNAVALSAPIAVQRAVATMFAIVTTPQGGWIGVQINGQRLLDGITDRASALADISIADTSVGAVVIAGTDSTARVVRRVDLPVFGRRWQLSYAPQRPTLSASEQIQSWLLLGVGTAAAGVVLLALMLQARSRRRAQSMAAQLTASESRRDRLLDASPVAVIEVTTDGRVVNENAAAAALLGHDPARAVGQPCTIAVHGGDGAQTPLELSSDLNGNPLVIDTPCGTRWVVAYCTDAVVGMGRLLLLVDESERHQLEERLTQAQKLEALGLLAGRIAHDFNNLLTPIGGYLDLVLSGEALDPDDRSMLEQGRNATERAAALVSQILTIARKHVDAVRPVDVGAALRSMSGLLDQIVGAEITLRVQVAALGPVPAAAIDPIGLEQVVVNLVTNARDATPAGGQVNVTVAVDGPRVVLTVSDTGAGMDESTKQRIFEPFYTTKKGRGTGLGLATVYAIVTGLGGTVDVTSAPGQGTTFTIGLQRVDPAAIEAAGSDAPRPAVARPAGDAQTVLLVEDEEPVRELVRRILERGGYRVVAAATAEEAQRLHAERPDRFDLLLSDVRLPGLSGPELAESLTARQAQLPVMFISGYTEGLIADDGHLPADTTFMTKPFHADELTRQVAMALANAV